MKKKFSLKKLLTSLFAGACLVCSGGAVAMLKDAPEAAAAEGEKVEVYQLAPNATNLMQSYVIKTASGKLIVIDGGMGTVYDADYAAVKSAQAYLPSALRAIAGKGENEAVEVEAWFLSHAHRDHFSELSKIMSAEGAHGLTINNFYFDFPDFGGDYPLANTQQADLDELKAAFNTYAATKGIETSNYYEDLNGAVINAESVERGLSLTVDGVRFDVLQTWANSSGLYNQVNDTSLVIRMSVMDSSVLFLNDLGIEGGARLTTKYSAAELKSDYVQLGHHGNTGLTKAQYKTFVAADTKLLFPITSVCYNNPTDFIVDEVYEWFNGASYLTNGTPDASKIDKSNNFFACLYENYPTDMASVDAWAAVVDGMKVASFDYEDLGFDMVGASVRTADPDGIRFIAQVADEAVAKYGANAKYGMIIVPADMDTGADLTVSYKDSAYALSNPKAMVIEGGEWWNDELKAVYGVQEGYSAFSSALLAAQNADGEVVNFPASFYNRPLTAVGFIIPENGDTVYTEKVTRSISYVASVEKMKDGYEEIAAIERIAAGAARKVSVNDGKKLENLYKAYEPTFTIGGMEAKTSGLVKVTYASSNPDVAKIVGGKVQPMANGTATITATATVGSKSVSATTDVVVDVVKDIEWNVLNDATKDFSMYANLTTSSMSTAADPVGEGYVKVTAASDWGMFYVPLYEDGTFLTSYALTAKYTQVKLRVYMATAGGILALPTENVITEGAVGWHDVIIDTEKFLEINVNNVQNYNDGSAGIYLYFRSAGTEIYVDQVIGLTAAPNYKPDKLETPKVEVWDDGTAIWDKVEGATAYAVYTDGVTPQVVNTNSIKVDKNSVIKVKALGDGKYYKDSDFSNSVTYVKKDMLNDGSNLGLIQASETYSRVTLNAANAVEGYFSYGFTCTTWTYLNIYLKKDGANAVLSNYNYLEMTVIVEGDSVVNLLGANDANKVLYTLIPGKNVIRIPVSTLEAFGTYNPANGAATFWLSGAIAMYIDNIVGVYANKSANSETTKVLNDASRGFWQEYAFNSTASVSTSADAAGAGYAKAVANAAWAAAYLPFVEDGVFLTTAQLQAKYESFTFRMYIDGNYGVDMPTRNLAAGNGWHDVTIMATELSEINVNNFQNYNDVAGLFVSFPSAGTAICITEVVGNKKVATSSVNFGNVYILGDSYSTYEGWIPEGNASFYTDYTVGLNRVEDTWWHQLITETGSNLVQNTAYSGTPIGYTGYGADAKDISFITRFEQAVVSGYFVENPVDTVIIFGGTNDAWAGAPIGEPDYDGVWTDEDKKSICPALCCLINTVRYHLPNAKIIVLGNVWGFNWDWDHDGSVPAAGLSDKFAEIVSFYKNVGGFNIDYIPVTIEDADVVSAHPNVSGMTKIKDQIINFYK